MLLLAAAATRAEPCVHFAREQGARMIAVSFKCRCQILRRLTKGTVLSSSFTVCLLPQPRTTAEWLLLSNMTAFYSLLSGNKEVREICTDLSVQVDSPGLCWFILAGFMLKLCVCRMLEREACVIFFFNDFIPC